MHLNAKSALRRLNRRRGRILPAVNKQWKDAAAEYAQRTANMLGIEMHVQYPVLRATKGFTYDTVVKSPVVGLAA